jgi:hypothetical protein
LFALQFQEETETTLPTLIENKFKANEKEIISLWSRHTDKVSKKILSVNPCLIQKKVIVFPQNLNDVHWMVTLLSTQAALTKTQSTDLDYKHASSVSVA